MVFGMVVIIAIIMDTDKTDDAKGDASFNVAVVVMIAMVVIM